MAHLPSALTLAIADALHGFAALPAPAGDTLRQMAKRRSRRIGTALARRLPKADLLAAAHHGPLPGLLARNAGRVLADSGLPAWMKRSNDLDRPGALRSRQSGSIHWLGMGHT